MTLEALIEKLEAIKAKHGADLMVFLTDTHGNTVNISNAKKTGGSFDAVHLEYSL